MTPTRIAAALFAIALLPTPTPSVHAQQNPSTKPSASAALPTKLPSPTDTAVFRRFTLDNGLKVLLVSDPKFNRSAASLVVQTGQIDDPKEVEGLAHFLEHMLFLGTKKYPDVNNYGEYITSNGGGNNAYTTSDHTNYQFQIRHDALPGALDRFSQFFIAPLFNADFTAREVNAVHNEAMRHVQNDFRRKLGVAREIYDPTSGESKFSTGNKDTLATANAERVRAFYESQYTADRMALSIAGKASLDDLERMAREYFAAIPKRQVTLLTHEPKFLPKKAALRLALVEPVKEVRELSLEFVIPSMRAHFAAKPDALLTSLIEYPGAGGLVDTLKKDGLIVSLNSYTWERTSTYGSLFIQADLTPKGQAEYARAMGAIHAYLAHLRAAPFPTAFYNDRASSALLNESYGNRGEGAGLVTKLANQALFYPLAVAERATDVWGAPDETAYRSLLNALTPDNSLVTLMAKGVKTDKKERIYGTAYTYTEDTGVAYAALLSPPKVAFALPTPNRFTPSKPTLVAERPLSLIDEKGLQLFYAQDTEFQRPSTTLIYRFVPTRDTATADNAALQQIYSLLLGDALEAATAEASAAGVSFSPSMSVEGLRMTISGFGDSPGRFAQHVAKQLREVNVTPARFEALKELALRGFRSYPQTEARLLASGRRDALSREFNYLPDEMLARASSATLADVRAFAGRFFAKGKLEALAHGQITPDDAIAITRSVAKSINAAPAPAAQLVVRRHLKIAAGEHIVDKGEIEGVNSVYLSDYLLADSSAKTRAAAAVLNGFLSEPFYNELRTKQQLGYIVGSSFTGSNNERYVTFVIQSSAYAPDELRRRAEAFLVSQPDALAAVSDAQWQTLVAGARSLLETKPKSIAEKADSFFSLAYTFGRDWERRQATLDALSALSKQQAVELLRATLQGAQVKRRTVMLASKKHTPTDKATPTFTDRNAWKAKRQFE